MSARNGEIDRVFAGLNTRLRKFKEEVGVETIARAMQRTPVLTGEMKRSWGFTQKQPDIEFWNVSDHSHFVEFGTPKMAPRAPLRTTLLEMPQIVVVAKRKAGLK